jgi:hypothetical protein
MYKRSFYQDRLGTNTGKTQNRPFALRGSRTLRTNLTGTRAAMVQASTCSALRWTCAVRQTHISRCHFIVSSNDQDGLGTNIGKLKRDVFFAGQTQVHDCSFSNPRCADHIGVKDAQCCGLMGGDGNHCKLVARSRPTDTIALDAVAHPNRPAS